MTATMEAHLTNEKGGRYTRGNAPTERTSEGSATKGTPGPPSVAVARLDAANNPPRTPDEKAQQRAEARRRRREATKEERALFVFCATETATIYEDFVGDYQPKQPGQKPDISDGKSHGRVPHDDELQADCERFVRLLAEAKDIDPDAPPVNIGGESIGGMRGVILQRLAREFRQAAKVITGGNNADAC